MLSAVSSRLPPHESRRAAASLGERHHREQVAPRLHRVFTEEFFREPKDLPPGEVQDVADTLSLPDDLSPGTYTLSMAVVGETDEQPVVRLGIKGRAEDGWYPLSKLTVSR